jgi:predicted RNase H-like HicB family nuclease
MLFNNIIEKDDNGYFAHIPQLKGFVSQKALLNIKEAAESCILKVLIKMS